MRLLVLSDKESNYLWDSENPKRLEDIDLILSCGDLRPEYLSFIATFTHAPVLYVHGNHDDRYQETPPDGCFCIENRICRFQGIRILGLGGSVRYRDGLHQYTQSEMNRRVRRLFARIFYRNAINIGLPIIECPEASRGIENGDEVEVDFDSGVITNKTKGTSFKGQPFPEFMQKLISSGGLVNYINEKYQ